MFFCCFVAVVVVFAFNEYLHLFQTADYAKLTRKFERKNNRTLCTFFYLLEMMTRNETLGGIGKG